MTAANIQYIQYFKHLELILLVVLLCPYINARSVDGTVNIVRSSSQDFTNTLDRAVTYVRTALGADFRVVAIENHRLLSNEWWRVEAINDAFQVKIFDVFTNKIVRKDNTFTDVVHRGPPAFVKPAIEAYKSMVSIWPAHGNVLGARAVVGSNCWIFICTDAMYIEDKRKGWMRKAANPHFCTQTANDDVCVEVIFGSEPLSKTQEMKSFENGQDETDKLGQVPR